MRTALFVLWLSSLGADRIDLLAGHGPFMLTPFLVLSPILLVTESLVSIRRRGSTRLPGGTLGYLLFGTVFLCTVVLSVLFSSDVPLSASRGALLCLDLYVTLLAAIFLANQPDGRRVLVAGACGGLVLALVFSVVEVVYWTRGMTSPMPGSILNFTPNTYGPFAPRISGPSGDSNRGGILFLVYGFLVALFGRPGRTRSWFVALAAFLLLATLSRSAMLGATVCLLALVVRRRGWKPRPGTVLGSILAAASLAATLLAVPSTRGLLERFNAPLAGRFALGDASSSTHVRLIARGWEVAHESIGQALFGVGFGNASSVLQDLLPGSKYANFHSLYITLLAEAGVFALILGVTLLVVPLWRAPRLAPLVLGLMVVNVSYQTSMEPLYWFVLALGWLNWRAGGGEERAAPPATPALTHEAAGRTLVAPLPAGARAVHG